MDTGDGNSPYITPPMGFPFMGKLYDRVYVSFVCIYLQKDLSISLPRLCNPLKLLFLNNGEC